MKYDKHDPNLVVIRADDVLQDEKLTKAQQKSLRGGKTWFQWFLEIDKEFEKYDYPMMLAICSDGIDHPENKEWVEHIKKNIHRYIIEFHGTKHYAYRDFNAEDGEKDIRAGIKKLEETFGEKVTTFYPPFGGKYVPNWIDEVCKKIGIEHNGHWIKHDTDIWIQNYNIKGYVPFMHMNYHFWYAPQNRNVTEILKILCEK